MALKSSALIETNTYEVEVTVDGPTFMAAVNTVFRKEVKKIAVPGFRKGKAPRAIIEKLYGEDVFYNDAMESCYPEALDDACKEAGLKVVSVTDLEVTEAGRDGFTFKAKVIVEPEIEIKDYKGIEVEALSTEVTEEMIDEEIDRIRDRNSRMVTVEDRAAEQGDTAVIDFEGFCDGSSSAPAILSPALRSRSSVTAPATSSPSTSSSRRIIRLRTSRERTPNSKSSSMRSKQKSCPRSTTTL